jgi:hypothetical protein
MIEVFKTNIQNEKQNEIIKIQILKQYPKLKIDFDLEDIDKVLSVEGEFNPLVIIETVVLIGFECEIMI